MSHAGSVEKAPRCRNYLFSTSPKVNPRIWCATKSNSPQRMIIKPNNESSDRWSNYLLNDLHTLGPVKFRRIRPIRAGIISFQTRRKLLQTVALIIQRSPRFVHTLALVSRRSFPPSRFHPDELSYPKPCARDRLTTDWSERRRRSSGTSGNCLEALRRWTRDWHVCPK